MRRGHNFRIASETDHERQRTAQKAFTEDHLWVGELRASAVQEEGSASNYTALYSVLRLAERVNHLQ